MVRRQRSAGVRTVGGLLVTLLLALVLTLLAMVPTLLATVPAGAATARAAAPRGGCELITARELERVLDLRFSPNPVGPSGCLWLSDDPDTLAEVIVSANDTLTAAQVAAAKRSERKEPDTTVLKGVGDLTIVQPQPKIDTSGNTTLGLRVFEGTTVGLVAVTIDGVTPTTKQMRSLAKILVKRL